MELRVELLHESGYVERLVVYLNQGFSGQVCLNLTDGHLSERVTKKASVRVSRQVIQPKSS